MRRTPTLAGLALFVGLVAVSIAAGGAHRRDRPW
jgi:hypothetical protein